MSWVVAFAFNCDISLHEMLQTLREKTEFTWLNRDSHFWGDYISAQVKPGMIAKIYVEEPGFLLEIKFEDDALRGVWKAASRRVIDEILPHLDARDVRRAPSNH